MGDFSCKIIKSIGVINNDSSWKKELNLVSWDGKARKFDIRNWDKKHERMSKGVTLTKEELVELKELLNKINIDETFAIEKIDVNSGVEDIFEE